MRIALIAAQASNRVIGRKGGLPWHIPEDLRHFRDLTLGKAVIMGRKTYESIGRPLPGRHIIVLTLLPDAVAGVAAAPTPALALAEAARAFPDQDDQEVMIAGGGEIYRLFLPLATRLYLTEIHASVPGDTTFPVIDRECWVEVERVCGAARDGRPAFDFITLDRRPLSAPDTQRTGLVPGGPE